MSYKDIIIEPSYETTGIKTQLLEEFYIPMLEQTSYYFRIAGFFSSTSLAIASKGIEGLIHNNGKMRLLISPKISEEEFIILKEQKHLKEDMSIFSNFDIKDFLSCDHLKAFAWMLANDRLEIKIVVDKNNKNSLFHQKVGIGYDLDGNILSFSGSINETAQAWLSNIEEFKTFKSWENGQMVYVLSDLKKFNAYWNDERKDTADVYDIPESIKNKIIQVAPYDINDIEIMRKYKNGNKQMNNNISLFEHQKKAVEEWENNGNRLLMEMATGTGKTRTAIGCFLTQLNKIKRYLVIVATPQNPLSKQWQRDIEDDLKIKFDKSLVIDGSIQSWNKKLEILLLDMNSGIYDNAIIYTIHETISNTKFIKCITKNKKDIKILFICDEVHGIGSAHQKEALLEIYDYRVGLSATPERMYDDYGTSLIRHYFGDKSFEFTIADALGTINPLTGKPFLNPYFYYPVFVNLNEKERNKYVDITKKIIYLQSQKDVSEDDINLQKIFRANILKNAAMKIPTVEKIIDKINKKSKISNTIIFATEEQVEDVLRMLSSKGISRCKITEHESYKERDNYISQFRKQNIQVLIGLKCLDEGIDVKNARIAIIMASSTNPREYVQRIGRVIRPDKNKEYSEIYDLIVNPGEERRIDLSILQKEAHRAMQIAKNAINYDEVKNIFEKEGVYADADK